MARTLVIAEPGCTHEGDYQTLLRLLETAKACGADVFKPQWVSDPVQMCERRHIGPDHPKRAYYLQAYSWLAFPVAWHAELSERCHALGMQYAVTCFLPQDVETVDPFVDFHKVASFENADAAMIRPWSLLLKPVVVSTGMLNGSSWRLWRLRFWRAWGSREIQLLHCTTAYPAGRSQMNVSVLCHHWCDGLSDHSKRLLTGAVAVACAASVVEAHYCLYDCNSDNPDYEVAFSPGEFEIYIRNLREAEDLLGDGKKRQQGQETWALPYKVTG